MEELIKSKSGYRPRAIGIGYKVFRIENGKLYPPKVANSNNASTPFGCWLDAEIGQSAGLSKTGRPQVVQLDTKTGKPIKDTLSFRPGWHLADIPRAIQFDRTDKNTNEKVFPNNFVWAKCEYAMDINYQFDAMDRGYIRTKMIDGNPVEYRSKKFDYKYAGLNSIPDNGYYRYKTNPDKEALEFIITGQIKVIELLDDYAVNEILKNNYVNPIHREGGDKTLEELGLNVNNL